jgi:DNA-binding FadR family transcriptional regulator
MSLTPQANLTFRIFDDVGMSIIARKFVRDCQLSTESELCGQYGVSRTILREAMKMLAAKGLIASRPGFGTWVQPEDEWNVLDPDVLRWLMRSGGCSWVLGDLDQVRLALEPHAAALAARTLSGERKRELRSAVCRQEDRALADWGEADEHEAALNDAYDRLEAAMSGEGDPARICLGFHRAVMRASGNRFLNLLGGVIETALLSDVSGCLPPCVAIAGYRKVLDAILGGDHELARSSMVQLIRANGA